MNRFDYQTQCIMQQRRDINNTYDKYLKQIESYQILPEDKRKEAVAVAKADMLAQEKDICDTYIKQMKEFDNNA